MGDELRSFQSMSHRICRRFRRALFCYNSIIIRSSQCHSFEMNLVSIFFRVASLSYGGGGGGGGGGGVLPVQLSYGMWEKSVCIKPQENPTKYKAYPMDTRRNDNVTITLRRRFDVIIVSCGRWVCLLHGMYAMHVFGLSDHPRKSASRNEYLLGIQCAKGLRSTCDSTVCSIAYSNKRQNIKLHITGLLWGHSTDDLDTLRPN